MSPAISKHLPVRLAQPPSCYAGASTRSRHHPWRLLARRLQLEQADAAAKAALADSMAARDEQQRTRDDLRSKLAEPSLNQAASLKEKIPTVETRKRVATTQLEQLEEEWARVDAEAKKKYQTVEKAIEDHLKVLAWCAHRLARRAHIDARSNRWLFCSAGRRARYGWWRSGSLPSKSESSKWSRRGWIWSRRSSIKSEYTRPRPRTARPVSDSNIVPNPGIEPDGNRERSRPLA